MKNKVKKDFKFLEGNIIYLDSAATTQKPTIVLDEIYNHYTRVGNPHSNLHKFASDSKKEIDLSRETVSRFLNAKKDNIVFTKSATESLNTVIFGLEDELEDGDEILISILEHHANIVPFHELIKIKKKENKNITLKYVYLDENNNLNLDELKEKVNEKTKILSLSLTSNVTGEDIDFLKIKDILKAKNLDPITILDISQTVGHKKIDVEKMQVDSVVFSAHKIYGPYGVGIMYLSNKILDKVKPRLYGGDMIDIVEEDFSTFAPGIEKFEGGTPSTSSILGFRVAIEYVEKLGIDNIEKYIKELTEYAKQELKKIDGIKIYSPENASSAISFTYKDIHPHDLATILAYENIAIRGGHHCAMPLHKYLNIPATSRVSFGIYNDKEDIDKFILAIKKSKDILIGE